MAGLGMKLQFPLKGCTVAVFSPSPILSVTIERGSTSPEIHLHAAGQGFWVARMAAGLGAAVKLCVPLGGETGKVLEPILAADGIELHSVAVEGANGAYVHDRRGGEREEVAKTPSPELRRHELDDLYGATVTAGIEAGATLLTGPRNEGVLPADTYERLARDLRRNDRYVLADLSGEYLSAALRGGVQLLKVSEEELLEGGWSDEGSGGLVAVAERLRKEGASNVLISRADQGALAIVDHRLLDLSGPRFATLDEHGAGDSMFAGVGVALGSGLPVEDALRVGVAAGALNVTRRGLGTGHPEEIANLAARVRITPLHQPGLASGAADGPAASTAS